MKANELMIGDLILTEEGIAKVVSIAQNGIYFEDSKGEGVASFDRIKPIPITPEILEKSGLGWNGEYGIFEEYFDLTIKEVSDSIWVFRYDCCEMSLPHTQITMSYIHELQRALRLCGIEKQIIL